MSSKTIFKYRFGINDKFTLSMPKGAKVLCVQVQNYFPTIWAEVDRDQPEEVLYFEVFGTGHPMPVDMGIARMYIGTIQQHDGDLVWHIYQRLS